MRTLEGLRRNSETPGGGYCSSGVVRAIEQIKQLLGLLKKKAEGH